MIDRDGAALLAQIAATLFVAAALSSFITFKVTAAYNRVLAAMEFVLLGALALVLIVTTNAAAAGDQIEGSRYYSVVVCCWLSIVTFMWLTGAGIASRQRARGSGSDAST